MRGPDLLAVAVEGLWRTRLRAVLAAAGVMVGTGALVSMLSFGYGMQRQVSEELRNLGLLETLHVSARRGDDGGDPRPLDRTAAAEIATVDGVESVLPMTSFDAAALLTGTNATASVNGLAIDLLAGSSAVELRSGRMPASDEAREALVSEAWLERIGVSATDAVGGALAIRTTGRGSLAVRMVVNQLARLGLSGRSLKVAGEILGVIVDRVLPSRTTVEVVGVAQFHGGPGFRLGDVVVPIGVASALDHLSFSNPVELLAAIDAPPGTGWRMLSVRIASQRDAERITKAIEGFGFRVFSFAVQFREVQRFFLFFDGLVAAIGLMALTIAALGITNTMLMAILERTREIGVLMSLGARNRDVRVLFLAETSMIGLLGGLAGLLLGWLVSRTLAWALVLWMEHQGVPPVDPFTLTPAIAGGAVAFAVVVSAVAGALPASRAARVDPVRALRAE